MHRFAWCWSATVYWATFTFVVAILMVCLGVLTFSSFCVTAVGPLPKATVAAFHSPANATSATDGLDHAADLSSCSASAYRLLFDRYEAKQVPALIGQSFAAATVATGLAVISVFAAEFLLRKSLVQFFYLGLVLTFMVAAPVRALGYYGVFTLVQLPNFGMAFSGGVGNDVGTSYWAFFVALVFGLVPVAAFPLKVAFGNYSGEHRHVVDELASAPLMLVLLGAVKSNVPAVMIAYTLASVYALSAYHEAKQFEQIWSAAKLASPFYSSLNGEIYAFATLWALAPVTLMVGLWLLLGRTGQWGRT